MTNRHNPNGAWITRRILAQRLRVCILLEDLAPIPEFETAIKDALNRPTRFEKFRAVYRALDRWGDVVPLEIDIGYSLSFTDTEDNFVQLTASTSNNTLINLSAIKMANIIRKGAIGLTWDEGTWTTTEELVPTAGWRLIRIIAVAPTLSLLSDDIQMELANLHNERLYYDPPLTIDPIDWPYLMHDGAYNASRTISKVEIRSGSHVVALSVTYLDGVTWRGGGTAGHEQTFTLTEGEHIVEMLTCVDNEWLRAIQFITSKGRCSAIYGKLEGTPTISKSEGGVLAGFSISTKKHPQWGFWMTGVNGIWRHDFIPRTPKENDVYSEYIGAKNQHGKGFNDRALIGNSSSIYITCVEIRAHTAIHSIEMHNPNLQKCTYIDAKDIKHRKFKAPRHGGSHGSYYRFDLERGEHIVSITGKYDDDWLTQLCFGTNLGRTSDIYGGGAGQSFSTRAPLGENGRSMRLQYVIGRCDIGLNGVIFAWTPDLSS
ncbi:unnamed protein product [Rhizoctonia solani]|uniref:Jacalin-type lectin domain-containing protein n=1 Tax=Rhizoctonia solani TaxID=456999 RepID=A0A8H3BZH1_9AGAM|nr:unnamed protein product [Rhizoctonia solani]